VLLDDDFVSIPVAVRFGRRIFNNLRKASGFIFAVHVPIAALALAPLILGWPLVLGPMHIAVLEMIIDPVCALAFEAEPDEPDIMKRAPRDPKASLLPRRLLAWSLAQGGLAAALVLGVGAWAFLASGLSVTEARGTVFLGLFLAVLVLIASNRSLETSSLRTMLHPSLQLTLIVLGAVVFLTAAFSVPVLANALGFARLPLEAYATAGLSAVGLGASVALLKRRIGA
jgi:P-type Ca2+ transporter type 2C